MKDLWTTILVPHDLSRHARRAFKMAAELAGRRGKLVALYVVNDYANPTFQKTVLARAHRDLGRAVPAKLPNGPSVERRIAAGNAAWCILEAARGADAIVMCTQGRTGLKRLVIGSVAEKVLRRAPVPVVSFRPGTRVRARRARAA